jgi:HEAT repeat protein
MAQGDGAFLPFIGMSDPDGPAREAARTIARQLEPGLVAFATTPEVIVQLARSSNPVAMAAVVRALSDADETVQRTALSAIGAHADRDAVAEISRILFTHESWAMRVLAAQAMGRLGSAGARAPADSALLQAAAHDSYALVREAALGALASFDADTARPLARTMAGTDPEPRVRAAAQRIASTP